MLCPWAVGPSSSRGCARQSGPRGYEGEAVIKLALCSAPGSGTSRSLSLSPCYTAEATLPPRIFRCFALFLSSFFVNFPFYFLCFRFLLSSVLISVPSTFFFHLCLSLCGVQMWPVGQKKCVRFLLKNLKEIDHSENLDIDRREIIIKCGLVSSVSG